MEVLSDRSFLPNCAKSSDDRVKKELFDNMRLGKLLLSILNGFSFTATVVVVFMDAIDSRLRLLPELALLFVESLALLKVGFRSIIINSSKDDEMDLDRFLSLKKLNTELLLGLIVLFSTGGTERLGEMDFRDALSEELGTERF